MWQIQEYKSCTKYTHDTGSFHEKKYPKYGQKIFSTTSSFKLIFLNTVF